MEEQDITAEEKLKNIEAERKTLKEQIKSERSTRLEENAKQREGRDEKIEKIQEKLKKVQSAIYDYNKLGKVAKVEFDILGIIRQKIDSEVEEEVVADSTQN